MKGSKNNSYYLYSWNVFNNIKKEIPTKDRMQSKKCLLLTGKFLFVMIAMSMHMAWWRHKVLIMLMVGHLEEFS